MCHLYYPNRIENTNRIIKVTSIKTTHNGKKLKIIDTKFQCEILILINELIKSYIYTEVLQYSKVYFKEFLLQAALNFPLLI